MTQITFSLQLLHVEIESVGVPTVAVGAELAAVHLLLGVVVLLGVVA